MTLRAMEAAAQAIIKLQLSNNNFSQINDILGHSSKDLKIRRNTR